MNPYKSFTCIIFLLFANYSFSQSKDSIKYYNQTVFCISSGIGNYTTFYFNGYEYTVNNNVISLGLSTINGIQIQNHQLGIGIGVDKWQEAFLFPVFLNYKLYFLSKATSLYGVINMGYSFGHKNKTQYDDVEQGSFFFKCGFGVQFKLTNKISFTTDLTYKLQNMRSSYKRIINPFNPPPVIKYNIYYNFIGLSIGANF